MNTMCLNYVLFSLMILIDDRFANCKINSMQYKKYVIHVANHFCDQPGWTLMAHVRANVGRLSGYPIHEVLDDEETRHDYIQVLNIVTFSLNIRYTEVLWYFNATIKRVIDKCGFYLETANAKHFNNCTVLLYSAVTMSADMFGKLFDAMQFISQINLKIINVNMDCLSTITNDIKPFYEFANSKTNRNPSELSAAGDGDIIREFENIKSFFGNVKQINDLRRLVNSNSFYMFINKNDVPPYLRTLYEEEAPNEFDESDLHVIVNSLITFYGQTIKNDYQDVGFVELLDPDNSNFRPPQDEEENIAIILNSILKSNGWNNLNYIMLRDKSKYLTVSDVVNLVNVDDNWIKRKYLSKLLRCRYTEILQSFIDKLDSLIFICTGERDSYNRTEFIRCAIRLYDTINRSGRMFDRMSSALATVRKATNHTSRNKPLVIENLVDDVSAFIEKSSKTYPAERFVVDPNRTSDRSVAGDYMNAVSDFRLTAFFPKLKTVDVYYRKDCLLVRDPSAPTFTIEMDGAKDGPSSDDPIELICAKLNSFYEKVVLNDYENLGFQ
ncbi:uncharacterized protein LOC126898599 [Daktulosphaira vitifoliae]|uniref:uncharacterized protein LOC126898599 n=1 Tax=Daktulosphaira vitifoliae TaxID=58002 RepID=UPI0021AADB1F|nr:uncharacterized protein LOC126898599 [Daktulosphaira vitifoliae]